MYVCMYVCMFKTICGLLFLCLLTTPNVSIKVKLIFVMTLTVLNMIRANTHLFFRNDVMHIMLGSRLKCIQLLRLNQR